MFGLDGPDEAESSTQAQRRLSPTIDADEEEDEFQSDDGWGAEDGFVSDSEDGIDSEVEDESEIKMKAVEPARRVVEVVDSSIGRGGSLDVLSKAEKRAFLVCPLSNM
jgi:rRNA-processing protein EBP2